MKLFIMKYLRLFKYSMSLCVVLRYCNYINIVNKKMFILGSNISKC